MHQIEGSTAEKGHFIDGTPTQGGTVVTADWLNTVQDEICNVITSAGIQMNTKENEDCKQLISAIEKIILMRTEELREKLIWCEDEIKKIEGRL